jgi:hypothetical protein
MTAVTAFLTTLTTRGWDIRRSSTQRPISEAVMTRYPWLPTDVVTLQESSDAVVTPDAKAWFLTSVDLAGESDSAFAWNKWELDSLAAAVNPHQQRSIRDYWDKHYPIVMSVKSGYAYFALRRDDMTIVQGEEPEYEEANVIAHAFAGLMSMITSDSPILNRWI